MFLAVTELAKSYRAQPAIENASFVVQRGERIGIVGANGSGKTTLLRLLAGEENPDGGTITLAAGAETGYLPQSPPMLDDATIADVLRAAVGDLRRLTENPAPKPPQPPAIPPSFAGGCGGFRATRRSRDAAW
ncbi:MAG: ATP-binding cassette domain-containing protein [Chloroflexi bacterium]|nr:ATP-binding cassette domain-containing protein [Chloroflexota bacterium]